jgi:predicted nucleotidyltransferase
MVRSKAIQLAQQYVDVVRSKGIPLEAAYVFGSQIKGTADRWSDIDTCLVSSSFTDRFDSRVKLMHLKHSVSELIEPHPFTPDDLQSKWMPLALEIKQHGVALKV